MSYENKPMTGVLFMREPKSEKHPDFKGRIILHDGTEMELAGWFAKDKGTGKRKADKNGRPWINLKLGNREQPQQQEPHRHSDPDDSDLPF